VPDPSTPQATPSEGTGYTAIALRPLADGEGTCAYAVNDAGTIVGESGSRPARWDLDGLPSALPALDGFSGGRAGSVNASGVIAGTLYRGEDLHPVRWDPDGRVHGLVLPGGMVSGTAIRINGRGSILGNAMRPGYHSRALRWDPDGEPVCLGTLPKNGETQAHGMNALDEVAGSARDGAGIRAAVWWDRTGKIGKLPPPRRATACDINDSGAVLGDGVVWKRDSGTTLLEGDPGFTTGQVVRITGSGAAIGWGVTTDRHATCVRWDAAGRPTRLVPLPSDVATTCFDIDDAGTVVGESVNHGSVRPVHWDTEAIPVPLPSPPGLVAMVAQHINRTGTVIIGYGFDPAGATYRGIAWRRA